MKNVNGFQGDVIFVAVGAEPKLGKQIKSLILAEGETTRHKHQVISGVAELYEIPDTVDKFLRIISDKAEVKHEEHNTVVLPKGDYIVRIAKEFDYDLEEARQVRD
jgi:hypothetical protein